jgi:hypothetical protein
MISIEEVNLWLMSNRLCVMPIADYKAYSIKLTAAQEKLHELVPKLRRLEAMKLGNLAKENKLLKKNLKRLGQLSGRLKTGELKRRLISLLARQRNWNSNTHPQTP